MATQENDFPREYESFLREYLKARGGEAILERARQLGRMAVTGSLSLLEVVSFHQRAMLASVLGKPLQEEGKQLAYLGNEFLEQVLVTYEMITRGYAEANVQLKQLNVTLEQQVRERVSALQESEARFRHMSDTAPVLVRMSGPDKLCTFFNKPWLDFTGRTMEQELGDGWLKGVHPDDSERCRATYVAAFDARQPFEMEYRLRRHDGAYRWLVDTGVPRLTAENTFLGYIGSAIDLTERKQAAEALRESNQRLQAALTELKETQAKMVQQERLAAVGQLTAGIAHDFNNILTGILGYAELLDMSPDTTESARADLAKIIAQGQRAAHLVRQILDFSRKSMRQPKQLDSVAYTPLI